jgi:hypothetical protein
MARGCPASPDGYRRQGRSEAARLNEKFSLAAFEKSPRIIYIYPGSAFHMSYGKFRWVFYSYVGFLVARIVFDMAGFERPEILALGAVGSCWLILLARFAFPRLAQSRWIYKLFRTHGKFINKLARPFGQPGPLERWYLHIRPPRWCSAEKDDLLMIYREQKKLLLEGQVALAMLVQANERLFHKGTVDAPANIIYTTETSFENPLSKLLEIAQKLFSLKGTRPENAAELKFAQMLSYDYSRDFRVTVPDTLAQGMDVTYTTIMIHRKHLPEGYLSNVFFPLLIHPESRASMILPARYWSEEMLEAWLESPLQAKEAGQE